MFENYFTAFLQTETFCLHPWKMHPVQNGSYTLNISTQDQISSDFQVTWVVGGAMVLGKFSVPGRPTNSDNSRARANCTCSRCGWALFDVFFSRLSFSFLCPSLGDGLI